ncbi:zona pellucida domain-containing protein 1 [Apostichopus japonicus]|uniref:Zona pellucida domain-containing protein 1 n=1 Tax=Stichopus japonicus TaxID=307972 RepID=A0A2G8K018_STIJA|nr:zona pellucida domain-containing protein 1 [Apostichopus japonicus]
MTTPVPIGHLLTCDITPVDTSETMADPDGDDVRCFFAINCGTGCFTLPGAVLDSNGCELTWDAASASTGLYGVSIEIMDFANTTSNKALSFIPLQFLVDVYSSPTSCGEKPVIIPPTRPHDSCLGIPQSSTYHEVIVARASSTNVSIIEIATISPPGMIKSDLAPYPYGLSTDYYINTTWTPTTTGEEEIMCFTAEDSDGSVSPQTCITLVTGNSPPEIIAMTPSRGGRVPLQDLHMELIYDQTVARPSRSTMISLYSQNGNMVYQVDSENRYQVHFPGDNTLRFTIPAQYLREMTSYYILMGSGVARSTTYCGIESSATTYKNEWSFFVTEVPEATTYFPVTSDLIDVTSDAPDVTTDTPGDDDRYVDEIVLLCGPTSFQIDIPRQLVEASFPATGLYLMGDAVNPNCRSFANYQYISLNSSLTECGTEYTDNATHSFYTNSVVNHDGNTNMIVEYLSLQIPISCDYDRSKKLLSHFVTISDYIMKREKGEFVYDFAIYTDISYTVKYNKYPVETHLGTNLFFRSELLRAADNLEIHLRSCRATPSPNYEDSLVYEFIKDGCGANSAAVRVLKPHKQTQADFELTSFRFRQDLGSEFSQVWIHCEVIVCDVNDAYSECHAEAAKRTRYRRSIKESDQKVKRVTRGPILLDGNDENAEKSLLSVKTSVNNEEGGSANDMPSVFTTALSVIFIIMVMTLMTMGVALHRVMRRLNYKGYEALSNGTD